MNFKKLSKLLEEVNGEKPYKVSTKGPDDDRVVEETKNYKRERQASPKSCKEGSFRTKEVNNKGDKVVLCKDKKTNKMKAQSILKKKNESNEGAKEFLKRAALEAGFNSVEELASSYPSVYDIMDATGVVANKEDLEYAQKLINHALNKNNEPLNEVNDEPEKFKYMLLDRLKQDCLYYIDNNGSNSLWAKTVDDQIANMKQLWNELKIKPEWLTMEKIEEFEKQMHEIEAKKNVHEDYLYDNNGELTGYTKDDLFTGCEVILDNGEIVTIFGKSQNGYFVEKDDDSRPFEITPDRIKYINYIEGESNIYEDCDVCKIKMLNRLDHIVKHCQDGELKQRATSLLDNLGMGVDVKEEVEKLFNEIDSKKSKKEKQDEMKPEEKITNNAIKGLMEELEELLNEVEGVELKAEPKRYIVQQIDREHDDVRQEEFDNIVHAVNAYNTLKNSHLLTELVDTKTDEILATTAGYIDESVNENKKAQVLGYNNGVAKVVFEHPITNEYSLEDFQNDRINIIDNNKDFQNFETRIVDIDESINEDIIDDIDVPAVIEEPVEEIEVNTEEVENNEEKDPEIEEIADEIMDKIEDAVEERIEGDVEEAENDAEDEITEPAEEDELFVLEDYKQYLRKGKYEDLQDTKREIDKAAQQGKSPEEVKAVIDIKSDDDKEKEEAEKYAVDKLTESLLATAKTSKLKDLKE